jgi:predicted ATPase
MLIQFRVENHRSLRDEQVLSMVAADLGDAGSERLIRGGGLEEALLPAVALYGANASGKSNVIGALNFMQSAVLESHRFWDSEGGTPQEPFAFSSKAHEPSLYEVDILLDGTRFRYGFVISAARIEEEWRYTWSRGRKKLFFEREGDTFQFAKTLRGENKTISALTRPNSLFLSAAEQNNHEALEPIFRWFERASFRFMRGSHMPARNRSAGFRLSGLFEPGRYRVLHLAQDESSRERRKQAILRLLRAADIGVLDIKIEPDKPEPHIVRSLGHELRVRHHVENGRTEVWLPLSAESAGTVTLLWLAADLVFALERGDLLAIDELEASLHPMLALEIVRLFNDPEQNPRGAQLIFTTHDTNLLGGILDEPPLRRDQVWFTEKDKGGATHLYPLTDFHPREEENLERGYLQGRYGAIPFLGRLVSAPEKAAPEKKKKRKG